MSVERNKEVVRLFTERCWGEWNLDLVEEYVAPDARAGHGAPGGGPQAYKDEISQIRQGIGDYRTTVDNLIGEGDLVCVSWTTTGRHTGALFGFPPTGKELHIVGVDLFQLRDGRIVDHWGESAMPMLLGQIGVLSQPVG